MSESLFSKQWYRVSGLRPQIKNHVLVRRHYYRREVWYVIGTKTNALHMRVNSSAYYLFKQFNGERTVDEVWNSSLAALNDDAPTQDEVVNLLSELFDATAVDFQQQSDVDQLFDNHRAQKSRSTKSKHMNPLFMRFSVFDPDKLVQRMLPALQGLFSRGMLVFWMLLCLVSAVVAAYAAPDIGRALSEDLTSSRNLIIIWFVFPIMKLLHELAHALAVRRWGGEVHEFGVALLVLLPVPYVDASESAGFANKYRRMAVAGAGIVVESTLACLALLIWVSVEPGLVSDVAFNVMLTGSVSCLLFNGNPLLKFDSYYVLSDAIEIPSLASRSSRYLLYLVQHYAFGMIVRSPVTAEGERIWLVGYGLLSTVYRITLSLGICLFVASEYFFIGVALAIWAGFTQLVLPLVKGLRFIVVDERLQAKRWRANALVIFVFAGLVGITGFVKLPHVTEARGVVWPVDDAMIRAGIDCLVEEMLVANGDSVEPDVRILLCDTTLLQSEVAQLRAELLAARAAVYATRDRVERNMRNNEVEVVEELLAKAQQKLAKTTIVSSTSGTLFVPNAANLVGRFFRQGELVGYLLSDENISIRSMLAQERIVLLGDEFDAVEVMTLSRPRFHTSQIVRRVPAATEQLVSPALGTLGGGDLAMRNEEDQGPRLREAAFELEIALPTALNASLVGEAVRVRFVHGSESLASQFYRQVQLLLLRRFNV